MAVVLGRTYIHEIHQVTTISCNIYTNSQVQRHDICDIYNLCQHRVMAAIGVHVYICTCTSIRCMHGPCHADQIYVHMHYNYMDGSINVQANCRSHLLQPKQVLNTNSLSVKYVIDLCLHGKGNASMQ